MRFHRVHTRVVLIQFSHIFCPNKNNEKYIVIRVGAFKKKKKNKINNAANENKTAQVPDRRNE